MKGASVPWIHEEPKEKAYHLRNDLLFTFGRDFRHTKFGCAPGLQMMGVQRRKRGVPSVGMNINAKGLVALGLVGRDLFPSARYAPMT
jgi:hypothetical protein